MSIQLTAINCFYGTQQVLFNIHCQISSGATVALLGPSGAGKSTLLRIFNLLMLPCQGKLSIIDQHLDFSHAPSEQQISLIRCQVGMVFQQYHLWPHLNILTNLIEAPCRVLKQSRQSAVQKANVLLERLGLNAYAQRYPLQLSGGQQQRVAIARALMMQPQVLLFDEPTAALDPEITAQIVDIINELAQTGITQLLVTHDVEVARKIADWIIYMEQGRIVEQGDASCLIQPKTEALAYYLSH